MFGGELSTECWNTDPMAGLNYSFVFSHRWQLPTRSIRTNDAGLINCLIRSSGPGLLIGCFSSLWGPEEGAVPFSCARKGLGVLGWLLLPKPKAQPSPFTALLHVGKMCKLVGGWARTQESLNLAHILPLQFSQNEKLKEVAV